MGIFHDDGFHPDDPSQFHGLEGAAAEARIPNKKYLEELKRGLELGLEAAPSIGDRTIPTFSRGELPHWAGINTFLKFPYLEDVNKVDEYECAILGIPFDIGTTYRPGTRFGPQAVRRISALYTTYNYEMALDMRESLDGAIWATCSLSPTSRNRSTKSPKRFRLSRAKVSSRL